VTQTVIDCESRVLFNSWTIPRLKKKILEFQGLEILRRRALLRVNELELIALFLNEWRTRLWAHANPVNRTRSRARSIRFDGDFEAARMQAFDQLIVHLKKRLSSGADNESPVFLVPAPRPRDCIRQ
jgi:hypothetical protein